MTLAECMTPGAIRKLTDGEIGLARQVFGQSLQVDQIRIFAIPVWNRAFVTGARLIIWPAADALLDFSTAPIELRSVFIHEMTHVWQAQAGVNLILAKLRAGDDHGAYAYDLGAPCEFAGLNIEQQAMIVQHAYLASQGGQAPFELREYSAVLASWPGSIFSNPYPV